MEYSSNSHKSKEEARLRSNESRSVISNTGPIKQKTNEIKKTKDSFFSSDLKSVIEYAWYNIVIPGAKKLLADTIKNGADMMLGQFSSKRSSSGSNIIQYNRYSRSDDRERYYPPTYNDARVGSVGYADLWFPSVQDAQSVKDAMLNQINDYGIASILDLYEFSGRSEWITPMHNKYGWKNLKAARIVPDGDGYVLEMPTPKPID